MEEIKRERIKKILIITSILAILIGTAGITFLLLGSNEKAAGICLSLSVIITVINLAISLVLKIPGSQTNEEIANEY